MGLVDGTCFKDKFPGIEGNRERVNVIMLAWIMNSVDKGLLGGIMYASCAQHVWKDLYKSYNKIDGSRTFKEIAIINSRNTFCVYLLLKIERHVGGI
uniref:Putative ovule protein n=1 Tax=Solanum chacoense TaxID=4108 RepID=A0A0V0HNE6_SOLCH